MSTATPLLPLSAAADRTAAFRLVGALIWLNLLVLAAIGVWFRGWQLGTIPGINGDEAWYGIEAMHWLQGAPVNWRTPTNNPLNLLYFSPVVLLHMLAEPSPALLRGTALASGLAALPIGCWLAARAFGLRHATIATVIIAVLPVNIAYSRFGWDASQTLLVTLPVVYLPLWAMSDSARRQRWLIAAAVCLLAAMWVHPTNIFAAPMVALPALWMWRDELTLSWRQQSPGRRYAIMAATAAGALATAILARHWLLPMFERLASPLEFGQFLIHYHRLFVGTTVYRFIAGSALADNRWSSLPQWDLMLSDLAAWCVSAVAVSTVWRQARRNWTSPDACLLISWGVMLLGFYLVAGSGAIQPHYERYALCLIAPAVVLLARAVEIRCRQASLPHSPTQVAAIALAWLLLLGFGSQYFSVFYRTGGRSHDTFRTSASEPKAAALAHVLTASPRTDMIWIVTSEYWTDRPLTYLASARQRVRVMPPDQLKQSRELDIALAEGRLWHIEFAGSEPHRAVIERLDAARLDYTTSFIFDFAGQPVLALVRPQRAPAKTQ